MSTYTFTCWQLFNVFGVRSIPNKQQCERRRNLYGAMPV